MTQYKFLSLVSLLMLCHTGMTFIDAQNVNSTASSNAATAIKIGFLISDFDDPAARHGAELAIREANAKGGYSGQPYQLIVRSTEGPWGTGSKESVSLVFDDSVSALITSLDGRNAHLVEQVAAKTRIMCLSAWATEMTLSQAFVPWHYRCVPNDDQQSAALIHEIYMKKKINHVIIIGTDDYDARNAVSSFIRMVDSMKLPEPKQYLYQSSALNIHNILENVDHTDRMAIVLFGNPFFASRVLPVIKKLNHNKVIFGSLLLTDDLNISSPDWNIFEGTILVSSGQWFTEEGSAFQKTFRNTYGYQPGAAAAYAYDATSLIIQAINRSGPDRDKIIDNFNGINLKGVTGNIEFDNHGNRLGMPGLMIVENGIPVVINSDQ